MPLALGNAVPRASLLAGKFWAALIVLGASLALGMAVSLLVVSLLGPAPLSAASWAKVAAMAAAGIVYLAFFVGLGLAVSSRFERPAASLVALLLVWVVLVVLVPNTTAGIVSHFQPPVVGFEQHQVAEHAREQLAGLEDPNPGGPPPYEFVRRLAQIATEGDRLEREFEERYLHSRLHPAELGRSLNRLTPVGLFASAMEGLADTGLPRHYRFIQAAHRYGEVFRAFVQSEDAADPGSHHLMGVMAGLSHRPVRPEAVPRFGEDLSARASVASAAPDLLGLALFAVAAFLAAHVAFLRGRVV
ncbi:MAG: ABC transporter permease subunit [Candidatus Latescibacterota bacterium]